jgi:hypothetical protein
MVRDIFSDYIWKTALKDGKFVLQITFDHYRIAVTSGVHTNNSTFRLVFFLLRNIVYFFTEYIRINRI